MPCPLAAGDMLVALLSQPGFCGHPGPRASPEPWMLRNRGYFMPADGCWQCAVCSQRTASPDIFPPAGKGGYFPLLFSMYLKQKPLMTFLPARAAGAELEPGQVEGAGWAGSGHGGGPCPPPPRSEAEPRGYPEDKNSLPKPSLVSLITSKAEPSQHRTQHPCTPCSSAVTPRQSPAPGGRGLCWIIRV